MKKIIPNMTVVTGFSFVFVNVDRKWTVLLQRETIFVGFSLNCPNKLLIIWTSDFFFGQVNFPFK